MKLRRVDPRSKTWGPVLDMLQYTTLPNDALCPYRPTDLWWVVQADDDYVAFGGVRPTRTEGMWYLCRAGVLPQAQGKGLQRKLIRARVAAAFKAGAEAVVTDCTASNAASANSLIACGFRVYTPQTKWALPDSIYWRRLRR